MRIIMKPRKLQEINGTLYISVPFVYCKTMSLQKGDEMSIFIEDDGVLTLKPVRSENEAE